jgi:flagellar biosynthesis protein FlhG
MASQQSTASSQVVSQEHKLASDAALPLDSSREGNGAAGLASVAAVSPSPVQVLAIASGKGGVGKTNIVANLSIALARKGRRVLAVDGDLGMANLDMAFGVCPQSSLYDLVHGTISAEELVTPAPGGVALLPACSGQYSLANLSERQRHGLFAAIDKLESSYDNLVIDTAAGIGSNAIGFAGAAEHIVVVACPEPTSIIDAYAFIKVVAARCDAKRVALVANMVRNAREGARLYDRMAALVTRFLNVGIDYLGHITRDASVTRSIRAGVPFLIAEPQSQASADVEALAERVNLRPSAEPHGGVSLFWKKLLGYRAG